MLFAPRRPVGDLKQRFAESYDSVVKRYRQAEGDGGEVAPEIMEPYLLDTLQITRTELRQMTYDDVQIALAYADGRALAHWAGKHPHPNWNRERTRHG